MELSLMDRVARIFWLIGPFILLIERSPADIWISILSLAFVCRVIRNRDYKWISNFWVCTTFSFWLVCLLSAAVSSDPLYAFGEAFVWIRFPLFAMATVFWLGCDKRLLYLMLLSTAMGFLVMCGILAGEIVYNLSSEIIYKNDVWVPGNRLSWPYGDFVPGNYLTKVGLPVIVIASAIAVSRADSWALLGGLFVLIGLVFVFLTAERVNTLIMLCAALLASVAAVKNWRGFISLFLIIALMIAVLIHFFPEVQSRFLIHVIEQLPLNDESVYYRAMLPGILAFEQSPIFGIGTANFRNLCPEVVETFNTSGLDLSVGLHNVPKIQLDCHPHPHNYYIQLLAETGILGFLIGIIFLWSIVLVCFSNGFRARDNIFIATAWVVPFALFWPTASTADFFGQWNNIFLWSSVALALALASLKKV